MKVEGKNLSLLREWIALTIIAAVYLLARAYPLAKATPQFTWEGAQAKKLQEYGFWERQGAMLWPQVSQGKLAHPERFNYVHHPYPWLWLIVAVQSLFGLMGGVGLVVILGLATCVATYFALRVFYDPLPALFSAIFVAVAPVFIWFTVAPTPYGLGGALWVLGVLLIGKSPHDPAPRRTSVFLLGLTMFLAGQLDWSTFTAVPGLLVVSAVRRATMREMIKANLWNPWWMAILTGVVLSTGLFVLQILHYDPRVYEAIRYVQGLSSTQRNSFTTSYSHGRLLLTVLLRSLVLVGLPLLLGLVAGIGFAVRQRRLSPLLTGALCNLACFAVVAGLWPFFFVREQWVYTNTLFPLACLSACALQQWKRPVVFWLFGLLTLPGVLYLHIRGSIPLESRGSLKLSEFLTQQTAATDLVLSNLRPQQIPFPTWDHAVCECAATRADRLFFCEVDSLDAISAITRRFGDDLPPIYFLRQVGGPMDSDLDKKLKTDGQKLLVSQLVLPPERETWALHLRSFYWKLQGKYKQLAMGTPVGQQERTLTVELYRLR